MKTSCIHFWNHAYMWWSPPPRCVHPEVSFGGAFGVAGPAAIADGCVGTMNNLAAASGLQAAGAYADANALKALHSIPVELTKHSSMMSSILKRLPLPFPEHAMTEVAQTCGPLHGSLLYAT